MDLCGTNPQMSGGELALQCAKNPTRSGLNTHRKVELCLHLDTVSPLKILTKSLRKDFTLPIACRFCRLNWVCVEALCGIRRQIQVLVTIGN